MLRSTQNVSECPLTACWRFGDQGRTGPVGTSPVTLLPVRLTGPGPDPAGALADPSISPRRAGFAPGLQARQCRDLRTAKVCIGANVAENGACNGRTGPAPSRHPWRCRTADRPFDGG